MSQVREQKRVKHLVLLMAFSVGCSAWVLPSSHLSKSFRSNNGWQDFRRQRWRATGIPDVGSKEQQAWRQEDVTDTDFVICGGGPAGLLCGIMLAQKFPKVRQLLSPSASLRSSLLKIDPLFPSSKFR